MAPGNASLVRRLVARVRDLLFPPRCVACGASGAWLCAACIARVELLAPNPAPVAHQLTLPPLAGVRAAARYREPLRRAIHRYKYEGLYALAPTLGQMLVNNWMTAPWPVDAIVPVPLHRARLKERGYNQSALLARELGRATGIPVVEGVLLRSVRTRPQVELAARERAANVRGAFSCAGTLYEAVLLVDDVLTTGATLCACAQALRDGGAREVYALTLAQD